MPTHSPLSSSSSPSLWCPPRYSTRRNPNNPSHGPRVAAVARALGFPLMPWQEHVANIAGEVDPKTGLPVYREIVLLVPRQSGKTTLMLAESVYRAFGMVSTFGRPQNIVYTAQTGDDAIVKWKEHVELLEGTPFGRLFQVDSVNGRHALRWANGSSYRPSATTTKSGHGKTLDEGIADEYFSQVDTRVEQAFIPAMIRRADAQAWFLSTAGDAQSIPLNAKIEANRERLDADVLSARAQPTRIAYFEWSDDPSNDRDDVDNWKTFMPALASGDIRIEDVLAARESMTDRDFDRAFRNITDRGASKEMVFDTEDWSGTGVDTYIAGPREFALDVALDRSWSSVSWAGQTPDGQELAEVVKHERGTTWVVPFLIDKFDRFPRYNRRVYVVGGSPAATLEEDLRRADIEVVILSRGEYAAACAYYYDGVSNRNILHLPAGQVPLEIAAAGAVWGTGDARTWNRAKSTTIISPLIACTCAAWGFHLASLEDYDVLDSIA
ncbi:MAG TPA: hypothetical protein VGC45_15715 [Gryllotalpicola sp.]